MSLFNEESIPEIIKDIDCIQETQQHSVIIEHNWSINDICDLICSKRPGEKIESEQFSYNSRLNSPNKNKSNKLDDLASKESYNCKYCIENCNTCKSLFSSNSDSSSSNQSDSDDSNSSEKQQQKLNGDSLLYSPSAFNKFSNLPTSLSLQSELICDYFLNNSLWRLEINKSSSDLNFISVNLLMLNNLATFSDKSRVDANLLALCQNCDKLNINAQLKLKLKFYLFNDYMNDIFEKQAIETYIDLKKFLGTLAFNLFKQTSNKNKPKLIEKFTIDKFCKIKDLLKWLNKRKSDDFCLLTEFKIYSETLNGSDSNSLNCNTKSRLKSKLNNYKTSNYLFSSSNSPSSSPSPPPQPHNSVTTSSSSSSNCSSPLNSPHNHSSNSYKTKKHANKSQSIEKSSVLVLDFKNAWTIKNWRNFLMPGSTSHTFMNDLDISNIFSNNSTSSQTKPNSYLNDQEFDGLNTSINQNKENADLPNEYESIKFGRFRSKLFNLFSTSLDEANQCNHKHHHSHSDLNNNIGKNKIENLLKEVKWKLQLYPNGYNNEFEQNLSLFVNFSQLTGELAQFSPPSSSKKNHTSHLLSNLSVNNARTIEETFYDQNDELGLILLIKSPSSAASLGNDFMDEDEFDDLDFSSLSLNSETSEEKKKLKKKINSMNLCETFVKASFQISILDSNGKKVDKCQSEKQLFELYGSWGYKEYMTSKDLIDFKDKYLTNDFTTLNLNCKIVLFYTSTTKTNTNLVDDSPIVINESLLKASSSSGSIINEIQLGGFDETLKSPKQDQFLNLRNSLDSKIDNKKSKMSINESLKPFRTNSSSNHSKSTKKSPLNECNTLLYDLRRLFVQSDMYDLIIQAPIRLDEEFLIDTVPQEHILNSSISKCSNFKQFKVHKLILSARSEVFEKMFNSSNNFECDSSLISSYSLNDNNNNNRKASKTKVLNIIDFDAYIVEIFLKYLYTDVLEIKIKNLKYNFRSSNSFMSKIEMSDEEEDHEFCAELGVECKNDRDGEDVDDDDDDEDTVENKNLRNELFTHFFIEVFKISDKYGVYRLKQICELELIKLINCDTTVELLILSYLHNSIKLKKQCFNYLTQNVSLIIAQSSWMHLERNYPTLLAEAFRVLYFKQNINK